MISVALATYNSKKYVKEQLDSIRTQSVAVDEVVIVDDCSIDGTIEYVERYINEYKLHGWKIIQHTVNKGFIRTFTDAISATSGDIIILCDHDDIWLNNKVEVIKNTFDEHSEVLALATSFKKIDGDGNEISVRQKKNHANNNLIRRSVIYNGLNKMTLKDVAVYNISPGCTCAIRSIIKDEYLLEEHEIPHDWKVNIIAACMGGLYYLDQPTTLYRIYGANTIGLGHQSVLEKRKKLININLKEKQEAEKIVSKYNAAETKMMAEISKIFSLRSSFLNKNNVIAGVCAMIKSIKYGRLYESVMMDVIAKIKGV